MESWASSVFRGGVEMGVRRSCFVILLLLFFKIWLFFLLFCSWTVADYEAACRQMGWSGGRFVEWLDRVNSSSSRPMLWEEPACAQATDAADAADAGRRPRLVDDCNSSGRRVGPGVCGQFLASIFFPRQSNSVNNSVKTRYEDVSATANHGRGKPVGSRLAPTIRRWWPNHKKKLGTAQKIVKKKEPCGLASRHCGRFPSSGGRRRSNNNNKKQMKITAKPTDSVSGPQCRHLGR